MTIDDDVKQIIEVWHDHIEFDTKWDMGGIWLKRDELKVMEAKTEELEAKVLKILKAVPTLKDDRKELKRHMEELLSLLHHIKPTRKWQEKIAGELDEISREVHSAEERVRSIITRNRAEAHGNAIPVGKQASSAPTIDVNAPPVLTTPHIQKCENIAESYNMTISDPARIPEFIRIYNPSKVKLQDSMNVKDGYSFKPYEQGEYLLVNIESNLYALLPKFRLELNIFSEAYYKHASLMFAIFDCPKIHEEYRYKNITIVKVAVFYYKDNLWKLLHNGELTLGKGTPWLEGEWQSFGIYARQKVEDGWLIIINSMSGLPSGSMISLFNFEGGYTMGADLSNWELAYPAHIRGEFPERMDLISVLALTKGKLRRIS